MTRAPQSEVRNEAVDPPVDLRIVLFRVALVGVLAPATKVDAWAFVGAPGHGGVQCVAGEEGVAHVREHGLQQLQDVLHGHDVLHENDLGHVPTDVL